MAGFLRLGAFDFSTLEKLSPAYVSDELRNRPGDAVWRLRLRDGWFSVLVLPEFQFTDGPDMALRILEQIDEQKYRSLEGARAAFSDQIVVSAAPSEVQR